MKGLIILYPFFVCVSVTKMVSVYNSSKCDCYLTFAQNYVCESEHINSVRNVNEREARDINTSINVIKYHLLHKIRLC